MAVIENIAMIKDIVPTLAFPSIDERETLARQTDKSAESHERLMRNFACMNTVEASGGKAAVPLAFPLTVAAWNMERCLFPEESVAKLAATGASLVLLSEMDNGMARTAQRHPTADIAAEMAMNYAYGVEFLELDLGSPIERDFCKDDFNARGFHGNALMSIAPMHDAFMIRLPGDPVWFTDGEQPRIGGRMAIGAVIETVEGPLVAVSTHLESVADGPYRERQMAAIMDAVEEHAPGLPVIIGGDLNTGNHSGGDYRTDTLFAMAELRGFECHGGPLDQTSTRPSLITRWPDRAMKLDWFITKGMTISKSWLEPSLNEEGKPLSDHDVLLCRIETLRG